MMNSFSPTLQSVKDKSDENLSRRDSEDSDCASLLSHSDDREKLPISDGISNRRQKNCWFWVAQAVFFLFSLSMLVYSIISLRNPTRQCLEHLFTPSPALSAIETEMKVPEDVLGVADDYVGTFNETKSKLWNRLTRFPLVGVSEENMIKAGLPLDSARFPDEIGGGYATMLEGNHAIHCLNYLWEDHNRDIIPFKKNLRETEFDAYEAHYNHCVSMLRQHLMCNFDPSLVTFSWRVGSYVPLPNFQNPRKCRKFENFRQWATENRAHKPPGFNWVPPDDAHFVQVVNRVMQWDKPRVDKWGNIV